MLTKQGLAEAKLVCVIATFAILFRSLVISRARFGMVLNFCAVPLRLNCKCIREDRRRPGNPRKKDLSIESETKEFQQQSTLFRTYMHSTPGCTGSVLTDVVVMSCRYLSDTIQSGVAIGAVQVLALVSVWDMCLVLFVL